MPVGLELSKFALAKVNPLHHAKAAKTAEVSSGALQGGESIIYMPIACITQEPFLHPINIA